MSDDNEVKFKRKKNKKNAMGYIYLFVFVFLSALAFMSYLVKSYSPAVDVEIGNKEDLTLGESDMSVEIKSIDERLKWIQEEDEMPSVALREDRKKRFEDKIEDQIADKPQVESENKQAVIPLPEKPKDYNPVKINQDDLRITSNTSAEKPQPPQPKIPTPSPAIPSLTKVYIGNFSTLEDAMKAQEKVNAEVPDAIPFIKAVNDKYIVQLGSFSKKETADAFVNRLKEKGYNPKTIEK